jgi:hypothetical protein
MKSKAERRKRRKERRESPKNQRLSTRKKLRKRGITSAKDAAEKGVADFYVWPLKP